MPSKAVYLLSPGIQVRKEKFGLLFYDYRGPRLYFVPSRDLIEDDFFDGRQTAEELVQALPAEPNRPRRQLGDRIQQVLDMLETKGLIYGQSIC